MAHTTLNRAAALAAWVACAAPSLAAPSLPAPPPLPNVSITVDGQIRPGVYGRVEIGRLPSPQLVFPQPVVIVQPAKAVPRSPVYLHVPPGHAKNWGKHCHRYNACGQPVYFVKSREYEPEHGRKRRHDDRHDDRDDDRRGKGKGKGKRDD